MIDLSTKDSSLLRVREFYLARQPILDHRHTLFAYELLFRNAPVGPANVGSKLSATASVIAHAAQLGMDRVIGDGLAFVNVDADVIMSDIFAFLPREKIVLEIAEAVTPDVLARIAELAGQGFSFALKCVGAKLDQAGPLLPLVKYVKLNLRELPPAALAGLAQRFRQVKLVADKVETRDQFKACLDLGFDYFQGYYFAKPLIMSGKKLSPSQLALMDLMALLNSDADNIVIERVIKSDASLGLNLLRLVNSAGVGVGRRIDSLSHALMVLGRRQLQRWLQIMLYAEPRRLSEGMTPLLMLATTRGRLLELLAQKLRPKQQHCADIAFTVGIMSLMDVLFGVPMSDILQQFRVSDEVGDALRLRSGFFGELLKLAESIECIDDLEHQILPCLRELTVSPDELVELEMAAYAWSDQMVRYAM